MTAREQRLMADLERLFRAGRSIAIDGREESPRRLRDRIASRAVGLGELIRIEAAVREAFAAMGDAA